MTHLSCIQHTSRWGLWLVWLLSALCLERLEIGNGFLFQLTFLFSLKTGFSLLGVQSHRPPSVLVCSLSKPPGFTVSPNPCLDFLPFVPSLQLCPMGLLNWNVGHRTPLRRYKLGSLSNRNNSGFLEDTTTHTYTSLWLWHTVS